MPIRTMAPIPKSRATTATSAMPWLRASRRARCIPALPSAAAASNMTLNKHQDIRAGLCWIPEIAHLIRQHNNANVLVMPGRFIDEDMARKIMDEYFATDFEGGRHQRRIDKIPVKQ